MSKFLPTSGFKWTDLKELNKFTSTSSKGCLLKVDLKYLKELHNDYPLASDKVEIKWELLSDYQLKIADLYNIPIGNLKKWVPNFFDKEKYMLHYENLQLFLKLGSSIRIQSITMVKTRYWIQYARKNRSRKSIDKDGRKLYKLMNDTIYKKNNGKIEK